MRQVCFTQFIVLIYERLSKYHIFAIRVLGYVEIQSTMQTWVKHKSEGR
jgi:hypothetical protein